LPPLCSAIGFPLHLFCCQACRFVELYHCIIFVIVISRRFIAFAPPDRLLVVISCAVAASRLSLICFLRLSVVCFGLLRAGGPFCEARPLLLLLLH
jgi:hypothetical protein